MSSTIVVTRRYVCCSLCSLHKRETFCFQVQWVFSLQESDIIEPMSALPWTFFKAVKIFKSQSSHVGVQDFSANPPRMFCFCRWWWQKVLSELTLEVFFGLCVRGSQCSGAFSFGKKCFFARWTTQDSKGQVKILYRKQGIFCSFVSDFFFVIESVSLWILYFFGPLYFFSEDSASRSFGILLVWQLYRGCSHCGLHRDRVLSGRNFLSWPVRMPNETVGCWGDGWDPKMKRGHFCNAS